MVGLLGLSAAAGTAWAQQTLSVFLNGSSEVPPAITSAIGSGELMFGADHTLSGQISVYSMTPTTATIEEAETGKNGPAILALAQGADSNSLVVPPKTKLSDAQYKALLAGHLYVNVRSELFPGGEIRGQLLPGGSDRSPLDTNFAY